MRVRGAAAGTLVILVLVPGTAACGDSTKKQQAQARADKHWRSGLTLWHREMLGALKGISLLLSAAGPVELLRAADPATDARLDRFNETLAQCSVVVHGLGPPPTALVEAKRFALRACASLENGARLVVAGVQALQSGLGSDLFDRATAPLSAGQNEMEVAAAEALHARSP